MTIRGYIAIFYAVLATGVAVLAGDEHAGAAILAAHPDWTETVIPGEFEPALDGAWERDDLPAYLTEDPADWARADEEGMAGNAAL